MTRRAWLGVAASGAALAIGGAGWWRAGAAETETGATGPAMPITVYASESCGCCHKWMSYLERSGFVVTRHFADDVTPIKRQYGVPESAWSCHTALVGGYVVEGHVPADLIRQMVAEKMPVAGMAAPGMPGASPGMDDPSAGRYEIKSFTRDGKVTLYAVR